MKHDSLINVPGTRSRAFAIYILMSALVQVHFKHDTAVTAFVQGCNECTCTFNHNFIIKV